MSSKQNKFLQTLTQDKLILYNHPIVYTNVLGCTALNLFIEAVLLGNYKIKTKAQGFIILKHNSLLTRLQEKLLICDNGVTHFFFYNNFSNNIYFFFIFSQAKLSGTCLKIQQQEETKRLNLQKHICKNTSSFLKQPFYIKLTLNQNFYLNSKISQLSNQEKTNNFRKFSGFFPLRQKTRVRPLKPCLARQATDSLPFNNTTSLVVNEVYWAYLTKSLNILQKVTTYQNRFISSFINNMYIGRLRSTKYQLQKQSVKYKIPLRNTCKLFIIYVFGSFSWLYLINYSPKKQKYTENNLPQILFLFQDILINNLPLFQKNYKFYTKETSENIIVKQQNKTFSKFFYVLKPMGIKKSPHKFFQILEDQGKNQKSLFFRETFLQNYVGRLNNIQNNKGTKNSEFLFFARKPFFSMPLLVEQLSTKNVQYFAEKNNIKFPFKGPEFDFLPRRLDWIDKRKRSTRIVKDKKNRHKFNITFKPNLASTEQVQLFNYFHQPNLTLDLRFRCLFVPKSSTFSTYEVITANKYNNYVTNQYVNSAPQELIPVKPLKKDEKKNKSHSVRSLLCEKIMLKKANPFLDILSEGRLQSGFNFPDAPVIHNRSFLFALRTQDKKLINKKDKNTISVKYSSLKANFSSFFQDINVVPEIFGELKNQSILNKKKFLSVALLKDGANKTAFFELVYKPKLLQGFISYDQKGSYIHYKKKTHSSSNQFFKSVKSIIAKVPSFASQMIGLKAWSNCTYPFVNLDKHADIKTYNSYFVKQTYSDKNKISFVLPFSTNTDNIFGSNSSYTIPSTLVTKNIHNNFQSKQKPKKDCNNGLRRMYAPESFFGTPFLQLGERFTVDHLNGKNQMGLIFNVHNGIFATPTTKPIWPYASTGTSLNTVFGKKQLTTVRAKKSLNPVTNGRLVSQWYISNVPDNGTKNLRNKFSENSFFNKNNGTFLSFEELLWNKLYKPKALLRRLFSAKNISGKANRYTINPFMYYNPGTKRDRNIEDTMLTLEGFKKSRLFSNTHINFGGISLPLTTTKVLDNFSLLSNSDWALYDPYLQSILGGMRQRTESRRIAQNVIGAPISQIEELQKSLGQGSDKDISINNSNKDLLIEPEKKQELKLYNKEQKRKKFNSTNCFPLRTILTVCSHKPLSPLEGLNHVLRPTDRTEYIFYDYNPNFFSDASLHNAQVSMFYNTSNGQQTKPFYIKSAQIIKDLFLEDTQLFTRSNTSKVCQQNNKYYLIPSTTIKRGSGTTKGFYLENIFSPRVSVKNRGVNIHKQKNQNYNNNFYTISSNPSGFMQKSATDFRFCFLSPSSSRSIGAVVNSFALGFCSTNIAFNFSKILFVAAVWFSYKFLATPLSQSTQLLPAAFTEAVGLQSFQQKYRIIAANKTTQSFKNLAGAEKTLSELRDLIWTFRLVGTGGPRGEHSSLSRFPYIGGQAGQERSSIFSKARNRFLLVGPPGTGKTLLVKALAAEANVPVIVQPVSQLKMIAGVENPVSALFHVARQIKPCIIFLDELDTLGNNLQPSINTTTAEQKLGIRLARKYTYTLLLELDGLTSSTRDLLIIGATNRPDTLNPALIRSGRFETFINCNLPSQEQRIAVLSLYLLNFRHSTKQFNQQGGISKLSLPQIARASQSVNSSVNQPEVNYTVNFTQNLKDFYINYVASQCSGLSQASIGAVVNQSALDSMLHSYCPTLHTLKTLERAVESVKTLTPQGFTGSSKGESDFANQAIFNFFGNNKNNLQKSRISNGQNNQTQPNSKHKSSFLNQLTLENKPGVSYKKKGFISNKQKLTGPTFYFSPDKPKLQSLKLLRNTNSINPLLFSSTTKQNMQFLVYRAYQIASSPIFLYKTQNWNYLKSGLNRLFSHEVLEKNTFKVWELQTKQKQSIHKTFDFYPKDNQFLNKNSLEKSILKSYTKQAATSLYSATRPQNFKLFDKFGLCDMGSVSRETNLLVLKKFWCNGSGLKEIEKSFLSKTNGTYTEKKDFLQNVNSLQKSFTPFKSVSSNTKKIDLFSMPQKSSNVFLNLEKSGVSNTKQGQNLDSQQQNSVNSSFTSPAFVGEKNYNPLAFQVKTTSPLTTGWFRMYLSRPLIRYDSLSYIENKEYYPQNYYILKQCFKRSSYLRNVSTLSHFSDNFSLNNKNFTVFKTKGKYLSSTPRSSNFAVNSEIQTNLVSQESAAKTISLLPGFEVSTETHSFKEPYEVPGDQYFYGIEGKINQQNHLRTPFLSEQINHNNLAYSNLSNTSLEIYFNQQFQPIYLTLIAYFFHKACYFYKENRELLDYCVYNKLRYSSLYEFSVKQVCNKF